MWDILICSIEHRTESLKKLLAELEDQRWVNGNAFEVGIRVLRDNLEMGYGEKCQRLLNSSQADYVCFIDDDDMVAPNYVDKILAALKIKPDYVGFNVRYTEDGVPQVPVEHSLKNKGWRNDPDKLYRDIVHFNPIRRELALKAVWSGGNEADRRWANSLRDQDCVLDEFFIDRELYYYQHTTADTFTAHREPLTEHPPKPDRKYPLATWL